MIGPVWPDFERANVNADEAWARLVTAQYEYNEAKWAAEEVRDQMIRQTAWRRSVGLLEPLGSAQRLY